MTGGANVGGVSKVRQGDMRRLGNQCALCGQTTLHQVGKKFGGKKYKFCSRACRSEVTQSLRKMGVA